MFHILHPSDQCKGAIASVAFEGEPYGVDVSFFLGDLMPGKGPGLHKHPYAEICIVRSGQVAMKVDGREVIARAGDIVVIEPGTKHCFVAAGEKRLDMVCIHVCERFVIDWCDASPVLASTP
jgi:mannose-6-phosphate isomerase-like protein (cupin superfamily)